MNTRKNPYLLSRDVLPSFYSIQLEPNLETFHFKGSETITLEARKAFSHITLHALDLKITKAGLSWKEKGKSRQLEIRNITFNPKLEAAVFKLGRTLPAKQTYFLNLEFEGTLNDQMAGFYRTSYQVNGEKKWGAATQFEATDARRAFPCWDEPALKARFEVTLTVPKHLTALSNMPITKETFLSGGLKKLEYKASPIMPTYLLCFVVADLECIEAKDKNGIPIRVWTTPGKKEQGRFGLDVALHTLPYFSEWFGVPYALPKMDMVALPDFAAGAMENWGLVTYRETALLVDPQNSSAAARQRVAEVIDHELAHQWFGNLVTMEWWTDLWLNEGFASYMGPKAVANQFPEWQVWNQYIANEYLAALGSDALKNTHPIEIDVKNPHEIREIFDSITYNKGSVVNRMLELYLTEAKFRKGLSRYLKRYKYGNAKTIDLWQALEEVSKEPVKAMMASYTRQGGFPVLKAQDMTGNGKSVLELHQERFLFDGSRDPTKSKWQIPVTVQCAGRKKTQSFVMKTAREKTALPAKNPSWILLNAGRGGFYRTAYSKKLSDQLAAAISRGALSTLDILGLVSDAFALARAGLMNTAQALDLLLVSRNQTDYNLWLTIASAMGKMEMILSKNPKALEQLNDFGRVLFGDISDQMGWEARPSDSHLDLMLRSLALAGLGYAGDERIVQEARKRFSQFLSTGNLDPNLRGAVYGLVARNGNADDLEKLLALYQKTDFQEEKVRILRAVSRFRDPKLIDRVLRFALSPSVRNQDAYVVLAGFGSNLEGRDKAWEFVKINFKSLKERYKGGSIGLLSRIFEGTASSAVTEGDFQDARAFFKKNPVPGTERAVSQILEVIQSNIKWRKRDERGIAEWLSDEEKLNSFADRAARHLISSKR